VRIDNATEIAGVRVNIWMSVIGIVLAGGWLLLRGRPEEHSDTDHPDTDHPDDDRADDRDGAAEDEGGSDDAGAGVEEIEMAAPDDGAP